MKKKIIIVIAAVLILLACAVGCNNPCEHVLDETWVIAVEPTAAEDGVKHQKCSLCGEVMNTGTLYATGSEGLQYNLKEDGTYEVVSFYGDPSVELVIPSFHDEKPVTSIARRALLHGQFTSVKFLPGVTEIGESSFDYCTALENIELPSTLTSIGRYAFAGCSGLKSIDLPSSVVTIGDYAFSGCESLETISIPEGVTEIGMFAFTSCANLTEAKISASVVSIGEAMFQFCYKLESVTFAEGSRLTELASSFFWDCKKLATVELPLGITSIGMGAFSNCDELVGLNIPESVTEIGGYAFDNCPNLTSIFIPQNVTKLGDSAFRNCSKLETVTFAENCQLKTIGICVFQNCNSISSLVIPKNVKSVSGYAFDCTGLEEITFLSARTEIYGGKNTIYSGATIYCYENSYVHGYATQHGREIVLLDQ